MQKKGKLVIVGAGPFAEIADEYFTYDSPYDVVAFTAERDYITKNILNLLYPSKRLNPFILQKAIKFSLL